ncbi:MAG: 3-dehydroquinate synthase [Saprospiraceae bacterium]|nr:3-dehydroquinate synthase [Saprospiraceae bacterium]
MEIIKLSDYSIFIGDIRESLSAFLQQKNYSRLIIICDDNTQRYCLTLIESILNQNFIIVKIPSGEQHKHIETCKFIWQQMMQQGLDRKALVINLGGGVIGDMGGFCAATYKRGVDFVQIPTTLLSQVDASIGGKLGIDFMEVKNSIGVFQNPQAVFIDPVFLKTLSEREIRSGFAEIIKHSLIADKVQWREIWKSEVGSRKLEGVDFEQFIMPSLKIKQRIVEADPFEKGLRKALNFGHTIGHAVESLMLETSEPLLHGEAIAIGMICESYLSYKLQGLPQQDLEEISAFILKIFGHHSLQEADFQRLVQLMQNDKKNEGDQINFTLINPIGSAIINQNASAEEIVESLRYYNQL